MLDIHAHLYWDSYDMDRDAVISRAKKAGVEKMICVGTEPTDNPKALAVAEKYEGIYASVGLHPHEFNQQSVADNLQQKIEELRKLAEHPKVVAIGECGLDYFSHSEKNITEEQKKIQREGFLAQIALAEELQLPLIIHTRPSLGSSDAYEDVLEILQNHSSLITHHLSCVLHCYMGDTEVTKKFLTLPNVYFSFTGNITYPVKKVVVGTKDDLTETVNLIPLERIFVETDCPFLAPQSNRGKRNEPAFVCETAQFLSSIKNVSIEELNQKITENSTKVFFCM